jgi:hypothetical protein
VTAYRTHDGRLVPELAVYLAGREAADQLREHGVIVPPSGLMELGRSVVEHRPAIPPEQMERILAKLRDQNQATRLELETAPEAGEGTPEDLDQELDAGLGDGQAHTAARAEDEIPVQNEKIDPITEYLANDQDDEYDWS